MADTTHPLALDALPTLLPSFQIQLKARPTSLAYESSLTKRIVVAVAYLTV